MLYEKWINISILCDKVSKIWDSYLSSIDKILKFDYIIGALNSEILSPCHCTKFAF